MRLRLTIARLMYAYLFDSMVIWYTRQNIGDRYIHWYTATTLTSMGFLNLLSVVTVFAHWHYGWAERLFAVASTWQAAALALALLVANLAYSRRRRNVRALTPTLPPRSRWPAGIYILMSVVATLYISTLAPPPHR